MAKRKNNEKKIIILSVTLTIAVFLLIVCIFILMTDSKKGDPVIGSNTTTLSEASGAEATGQTGDSSDESPADSSQPDSSDSADDSSEASQVILDPASSLIGLTSSQIAEKLGDYSDYGFVNGGFTIYNYDIIPNMDFAVAVDDDFKILDENIQGINVLSDGKITAEITVGMTFEQMKSVLGEKLQPIEQSEESCMYAIINGDGFTATIEFEYSGGKSVSAMVMLK
jgi:hypothetical protein